MRITRMSGCTRSVAALSRSPTEPAGRESFPNDKQTTRFKPAVKIFLFFISLALSITHN
jgi:hypothetical protein